MVCYFVRDLLLDTDLKVDLVGIHLLFERVVDALEVELVSVGDDGQGSEAENDAELVSHKDGRVDLKHFGTEFDHELEQARQERDLQIAESVGVFEQEFHSGQGLRDLWL